MSGYKIKTEGNVVTVTGSIIDAWAADESGSGGGIDGRVADEMRRAYRKVAQQIANETGRVVEVYGASEGCQDWMIDEVAPLFRALDLTDGIAVEDVTGGVWWPHEDAEAEIAQSDDPYATAVRICREQPTRGEWVS